MMQARQRPNAEVFQGIKTGMENRGKNRINGDKCRCEGMCLCVFESEVRVGKSLRRGRRIRQWKT